MNDAETPQSGNFVIGIGNEFRCDDSVGIYVARRLAMQECRNFVIKESPGEGTYLMDKWDGADLVIIVDAVQSYAQPGRIHRIDTACEDIPISWFQGSSHLFSLPEAIRLSRTLDQMPRSLIIYGIEGNLFATGVEMTAPVKEAADRVIGMIMNEIANHNEKAVQQ